MAKPMTEEMLKEAEEWDAFYIRIQDSQDVIRALAAEVRRLRALVEGKADDGGAADLLRREVESVEE